MDEINITNRRYRLTPDLVNKIVLFGYENVQLQNTLEEIRNQTRLELSKKPNIVWQLQKAFIHALAEYPNTISKAVSREVITNYEKEIIDKKTINGKDKKDIIDLLDRELERQLCILDKKIQLPPELKQFAEEASVVAAKESGTFNPALEIIYFDEYFELDEIDKYFEKNGLFLFDCQYLEHLKTIGNYSRASAKNLAPELKGCLQNYKDDRNYTFDFCFNIEPTTEKPFYMSHALIILARAILHDIVLKNIPKTEIIHVGGHLTDLMSSKKNKIKKSEESQDKIVEYGPWELASIGLTGLSLKQHKATIAISALLHKKSQNVNPKSDNYYVGNSEARIIECGEAKLIAPVISFTDKEYFEAFTGREIDSLGGSDGETAGEAREELLNCKPPLYCQRKITTERGQKLYQVVEYQKPLIEKITLYNYLTAEEKASITSGDKKFKQRKGEVFYILNPVFRYDIASKFIRLPEDINRRIRHAAIEIGTTESSSTYLLLNYLSREHSNKRYNPPMNEETLTKYLELENLRPARQKDRITKDIKILKSVGLIESYEKAKSKTSILGQKYIFHLNPEWPTELIKIPTKNK